MIEQQIGRTSTERISRIQELFHDNNNLVPESFPTLRHLVFLQKIGRKPEAVVALGHNWNRESDKWPPGVDRGPELSIQSKITTLAAAVQYLLGTADKIIFSGGQTAKSAYTTQIKPAMSSEEKAVLESAANTSPTEAGAMREYITKLLGDSIPNDVIIEEDISTDTYSNRDRVAEKVSALRYDPDPLPGKPDRDDVPIAISSVDYHLETRANEIFLDELGNQIVANVSTISFLQEMIDIIDNLEGLDGFKLSDILPSPLIQEIRIQLANYSEFERKTPLIGRAHGWEYHKLTWLVEKFLQGAALGDKQRAQEVLSQLAEAKRTGQKLGVTKILKILYS